MAAGILPEKMHLNIAKFYNVFGLMRLVFFEPLLVSAQMFPRFQVFCVFGIQLTFFLMTIKGVFSLKCF